MGNGPGGLPEYQALFDRYPRLQGGFVWEWIDQGLRQDDRIAYGGDFGEPYHDGTFVIDGLVFPDRTPSPGLLELKKVVEPVRLSVDRDELVIANIYDFRDLAHIRFSLEVSADGDPILTKPVDVPFVAPGESVRISLPDLPTVEGDGRLTVRAVLANDEPWAPAGHEVAWTKQQRSAAPPGTVRAAGRRERLDELAGPWVELWRAELTRDDGTGLRIEPVDGHALSMTVRPWSTAELAAARHADELVPSGKLHLHLDVAHYGLGSASCGPGVLPQYRLQLRPSAWSVRFRRVAAPCPG